MLFRLHSKDYHPEIVYSAYSDIGNRTGVNQDAVCAIIKSGFSVFCVADGMGGHADGELASGEITKGIKEWADGRIDHQNESSTEIFNDFEKLVEKINSTIFLKYNAERTCGSTLVALLVCKNEFCVISAGDSRIYRLNRHGLSQLSCDDIWQGDENDPNYSLKIGKLLKAVGVNKDIIFNRVSGELKHKDGFFLCSDGLYKVLGDEAMAVISRRMFKARDERDLESNLREIKRRVYSGGAPDNNTGVVVLVR
ncbi:MAG: serine/threonine-protein phosphatase [Butyrivibrio sp.]|nr:serine/threonine-protein phosphatase [Butyrivibrio sp.]